MILQKLNRKSLLFKKGHEAESEFSNGYFLSLGAGHNQVNLIKAASQLGYKVIAVDRNVKAPGFEEAKLHMYCSVLQPKKIIHNLQNNLNIDGELMGVGCRSFGRANYSAALIAKRLSLPGPEPKKLSVYQDKAKLKKLMLSLGIPTAPSYVFGKRSKNKDKEQKKMNWQKHLPLVLRPISGHGKQGVQVLHHVEELEAFVNKQQAIHGFLLDKYIRGREINVVGFVNKERFQLVCITDKYVANYSSHLIELSHHYPAEIKPEIVEKICKYIQDICDATELVNSPFVAEFLLRDFDEKTPICMIECSPEIGGEYLADWLIPTTLGRDYFQDLVRIYTGEAVEAEPYEHDRSLPQVSIRFIAQSDGQLKRLEFPSYLKEREDLLFAYYLKKPGDKTSLKKANLDRLAVFGLQSPLNDPEHYRDIERIAHDTIVEY